MGIMKRKLEALEEKKAVSRKIAVDSAALESCEIHPEMVSEGSGDIDEAYAHGAGGFKSKKYDKIFDSLADMREVLAEVIKESAMECSSCDRMLAE
jgi:hypothetical protein